MSISLLVGIIFFKVIYFRGFSFIHRVNAHEKVLSPPVWTWQWWWDTWLQLLLKWKMFCQEASRGRTFWDESVSLKKKNVCSRVFTACLISECSEKHPGVMKLIQFLIHFSAHILQKPSVCLLPLLHLTGVILSWVLAVRGWPWNLGCKVLPALWVAVRRDTVPQLFVCREQPPICLESGKALDSLAWNILWQH